MDFPLARRDDRIARRLAMTSKAMTLHAPSIAPEIAITAFVLLVLVASAALLFCWLGLGA
jgi:hypothetical protein